jgi:hypothetical protein
MKLDQQISSFFFSRMIGEAETSLNDSIKHLDTVQDCLDLSNPEAMAFAQTLLSAKAVLFSVRNTLLEKKPRAEE